MIFPQLGPVYLDENNRSIASRMDCFYTDNLMPNMTNWSEMDLDTRYYCGDQQLWNDVYGNLPLTQRKSFNFNHIRRIISMVSGYQRRNRKSIIITPIESKDQKTADQFTKILYWFNQKENALETISDCFESSLISGLSFLQFYIDYRNDPISGDIKVARRFYNEVLIDPYFKKPDLSDCDGIQTRTYVSPMEAMSLLPDMKENLVNLYGEGNRDGKWQFQAESYMYAQKNLLTYDEFYYRAVRRRKLLVDVQSGETTEWSGDEDQLRYFLQLYPQITVLDQDIPTVKLAIRVQGKVMYDGLQPSGLDRYPFVPMLTYYHPEMPYLPLRVMGMTRNLRDAAYLYTRRMVIMLDILESQINSGWKYKENALVNPLDQFLTGQGKGLALKKDAQMTDAEQIQPPQVPPSMLQLADILDQEAMKISGVNEELLGSAQDDKAGILSMLRQGAGLTTLEPIFDRLDRACTLVGSIVTELIQKNFTVGKVKNILGEEPTEAFYNRKFGKYHAAVEEGFNTTTQKQMEFAQLLHLKQAGINIPESALIDAATIQNKDRIMQQMAQQAQMAQQQQQAQAQMAMQEQQATMQMAQARAAADQGLGMERMSRIQDNQAQAQERKATAEKDNVLAVVSIMKTLKELEGMDMTKVQQAVQVVKDIVEQQKIESMERDQVRSALNQVQQPAQQ